MDIFDAQLVALDYLSDNELTGSLGYIAVSSKGVIFSKNSEPLTSDARSAGAYVFYSNGSSLTPV